MPAALWLGFFAGFEFKGLWLGLLVAQGSCVVSMLLVLAQTEWHCEAQRAQALTAAFNVDDDHAPKLKDDDGAPQRLNLLGDCPIRTNDLSV
ncbi:hypothetical protein Nepgr_011269 [Nepenthes gracilis]|uniref:Uncharacterized protein n=1 Tax=Nepenthes gracilis TaxID=150966 RepID=A0AAD3SE07_NEPGR|nr:hypothetical protein Nepgr_011269 [Nepenthes gracilis]